MEYELAGILKTLYSISGSNEIEYPKDRPDSPIPGPINDAPPRDWKFPRHEDMDPEYPMRGNLSGRNFDSERKLMEKMAFDHNVQFNQFGQISSAVPFNMVMYVTHNHPNGDQGPRLVCEICRQTIPLFKKVFPAAKIVFADQDSKNTGKCY